MCVLGVIAKVVYTFTASIYDKVEHNNLQISKLDKLIKYLNDSYGFWFTKNWHKIICPH